MNQNLIKQNHWKTHGTQSHQQANAILESGTTLERMRFNVKEQDNEQRCIQKNTKLHLDNLKNHILLLHSH